MPTTLPKRRIISINVSMGSYNQFVTAIIQRAATKVSSYVCVANVHMLAEAHKSRHFRKVVNSAFLVTPDGMPIAKAFRSFYKVKQERVDGMSLLPILLKEAESKGMSVFFYGGTETMLEKTQQFLKEENPFLKIAGVYSPPFRPLTEVEMNEMANRINATEANLVFVVLGCPKQEMWMYNMKGKINATMIGIGGALPVLIGAQKRAPRWMQKNSLEWLFRLNQEPTRLFKRYLKTNVRFLYLFAKKRLVVNTTRRRMI